MSRGTFSLDKPSKIWYDKIVAGADGIAALNPIRYRGYYYDTHTGLYYLQSRYYNHEWGRFISMDDPGVLGASPEALTDKNLYIYCDNNPVMRTDATGDVWESVFDIASLVVSIVDVCVNPSDPMAWVGLVGDTIDLIPFVTGVGELAKVARVGDKIVDTVDNVSDAVRAANKVDNVLDVSKTVTPKVHGNSLSTAKAAQGYILRDIDTHEILKYGETTRGYNRYTNKYLMQQNAYMDFVARGTKAEMHQWQHEKILNYTMISGQRPPLNKSFW